MPQESCLKLQFCIPGYPVPVVDGGDIVHLSMYTGSEM